MAATNQQLARGYVRRKYYDVSKPITSQEWKQRFGTALPVEQDYLETDDLTKVGLFFNHSPSNLIFVTTIPNMTGTNRVPAKTDINSEIVVGQTFVPINNASHVVLPPHSYRVSVKYPIVQPNGSMGETTYVGCDYRDIRGSHIIFNVDSRGVMTHRQFALKSQPELTKFTNQSKLRLEVSILVVEQNTDSKIDDKQVNNIPIAPTPDYGPQRRLIINLDALSYYCDQLVADYYHIYAILEPREATPFNFMNNGVQTLTQKSGYEVVGITRLSPGYAAIAFKTINSQGVELITVDAATLTRVSTGLCDENPTYC